MTSIESWAFGGCNSIENVTFHCKEIKNYWFPNQVKTNIKNVVIGDGVNTIDNNAFSGYSSLTSVTMSNSVTAIGSSAFENCTCLKSITIPSSVNSIEGNVFSGCRDLSSINVASENKVFDSRNNCNAIIETATNTLVVGCKNTVIPNSVIKIGERAFYGCSGLTSVTIPNSVTTIRMGAFSNCSGLASVIIGNSVTIIDDFYFSPPSAFSGCSLTSIIVDSGNKKYDSRNNCNAIIETATNTLVVGCKNTVIPNSVTSIGEHAFDSCSELTSITIPNSVTSIGSGAFINCSSLTSVTIPNSVTTIGSIAFYDCTSLSTITIPDGVTSIGDYAFDNTAWKTEWLNSQSDGVVYLGKVAYTYKGEMPSNTEIILDAETKGIAGSAFWNQRNLTSIIIPSGVTNIGTRAFRCCFALNKVTCRATIPPIIGSSGFEDIELSNCKLFVSKGCVDAYKTAGYWKDFGMIQEEDESTPVQPIINRCDNGTYYNLNGQRVTKPTKGLYIVNGKKLAKR